MLFEIVTNFSIGLNLPLGDIVGVSVGEFDGLCVGGSRVVGDDYCGA